MNSRWNAAIIGFVVSLALLILIYSPGIHESPNLIDDENLLSAPQLNAGFNINAVAAIFTPGTHVDYYPVRDLSYVFDKFAAGETGISQTLVLHLSEIAWTALLTAALASLLNALGVSVVFSVIGALLWALHPYHSEMVMWISARKDVMALFFGVCAARAALKERPSAFFAVVFFILSLFSKSSLSLLPLAGLFYELAFGNNRKRIKIYAVTAPIGLGVSAFQSWFYSHVNDERFFYQLTYRLKASLAALGKMTAGLVWPGFNIVDVENWGKWADLNSPFALLGATIWAALLIGCLWAYFKSKKLSKKWLPVAAVFVVLYFPVSGLGFPHRQFYSVRYFEAPAMACFVFLMTAISKRANLKISLIVLALFAIASAWEARNWQDFVALRAKAVSQSPMNPSLKTQLLMELKNHLNHEPSLSDAVKETGRELASLCPVKPVPSVNGDLCQLYYQMTWQLALDAGNRAVKQISFDAFMNSASLVKPEAPLVSRIKIENDLSDGTIGAQDFGFISKAEGVPTPRWRYLVWVLRCLNSDPSGAENYLAYADKNHLIDRAEFKIATKTGINEKYSGTLDHCLSQ